MRPKMVKASYCDPFKCDILGDSYVQRIRSGNVAHYGHTRSTIMQNDGHTRSLIMENDNEQEIELTRRGKVANGDAYATIYDMLDEILEDFCQRNGEIGDDRNVGAGTNTSNADWVSGFKILLQPYDFWKDGANDNKNVWRNASVDYGNGSSSHQQNANVHGCLDPRSERFIHMGRNSIYDYSRHWLRGTLDGHSRNSYHQNGNAESSVSYLDQKYQGFNCSPQNSTYPSRFWKYRQFPEDGVAGNGGGQNSGRDKRPAVKHSFIDDDFEQQHDQAMEFALLILGVKDLLHVERVCRSLRVAVREDPLLWSHIRVESPPYRKFMNDDLLELSKRAQGNLKCLVLIHCCNITDYALCQIVRKNPHLKKISLPGCAQMTVQGLLHIIAEAKDAKGMLNLRFLGVSGGKGLSLDEIADLRDLMLSVLDNPKNAANGSVEIDICADCGGVTIIYDVPGDKCHGDDTDAKDFKDCFPCMPKCNRCSKHIRDGKYIEEFTCDRKYIDDLGFDAICLDCSHKFFCSPNCHHQKTYEPDLD